MCSIYSHDDLKRDPVRFEAETKFAGFQPDGDGGLLELRNHQGCGSTLAIEATRTPTRDELMLLAERYASHCRVGEVLEDGDRYYTPFCTYIPGALAKKRLHLERVPGGWKVCQSQPNDEETQPAICRRCLKDGRGCNCLADLIR